MRLTKIRADNKRLYFVERFFALLQKEDFERLVVALHKYGRGHAPVGSQTLDKLLVLNVYKKSHTRSGCVKLSVEEAFCLGAGNAVHIDVARAQERLVAVSHIQLKARQVGIVFCVEACVGVAEDILNPQSSVQGGLASKRTKIGEILRDIRCPRRIYKNIRLLGGVSI